MANGKAKNASLSIERSTRPKNKPRNIILFSDGTANSAASADKTNVWRLFEALDLGQKPNENISLRSLNSAEYKQLAFYNDGVGTSGFVWWQYLAQGLGLGVSKNVKNLYSQLCQHYQPGDRVYVFGFSRGAYTARVLCDMVATCGILDREKPAPDFPNISMETKKGFTRGVSAAHKAYRRYYWETAGFFPKWANRIWNFVLENVGLRKTFYTKPIVDAAEDGALKDRDFFATFSHSKETIKEAGGDSLITFLGVWDTVASHGISVQEIADIWNLVYPYKFTDYKISKEVKFARHALALDDERQSFLPVLMDEHERDENELKQVWFAGMHADVGGGYPDDNLAYLPLKWMATELQNLAPKERLIFKPGALDEFRALAQPTGRMHDSRRGIKSFFRYKPRNIAELSKSALSKSDELLKRTVVHQSALDRILDSKAGYAPPGLPQDLHICDYEGKIKKPTKSSPYYPLEADAENRAHMHERAQNHVFWRRVCYFGMLLPILMLFFMPLFEPSIPGWIPTGGEQGWYLPHRILTTLFPYGGSLIPGLGFFSYWTDVWGQSAWWTVTLIGIGAFFFFFSFVVQSNIQRLAEAGWWSVKGNETSSRFFRPSLGERVGQAIRWAKRPGSAVDQGLEISKVLLGIVFISLLLGAAIIPLKRWFVVPGDINYTLCKADGPAFAETENRNGRYIIKSSISDPCIRTSFLVKKGELYRIFVRKGAYLDADGKEIRRTHDFFCTRDRTLAPWFDERIKGRSMPASNRGLICPLDYFVIRNMTDNITKRIYLYPWMMLVAQIGDDREQQLMPLNRPEILFKAQSSGRLSFFVNQNLDEVGLIPGEGFDFERTTKFYRRMKGDVELVVHKLD